MGETVLKRRHDTTIPNDDKELVMTTSWNIDATHSTIGFSIRHMVFSRTSLDRKDFGLKWNQVLEAGGALVGDRVDIELDIQAVNTAARDAAA
jgi:polyisoprenoid-binding protein YceI